MKDFRRKVFFPWVPPMKALGPFAEDKRTSNELRERLISPSRPCLPEIRYVQISIQDFGAHIEDRGLGGQTPAKRREK